MPETEPIGAAVTKKPGAARVVCSNWEDFQRKVRERARIGNLIYRGQRDPAWRLQSIFERWLYGKVDKAKWPKRGVLDTFPEEQHGHSG